jgi:hypothetical protein
MKSELNGVRLKIFTRSFDLQLYSYARELFRCFDVPIVRLTDQTADGYFYTMLKDTECDIAINIDEDAFVVNPQAMLDLVEFVVIHGYANAGCPDGGGGCPRSGNPIVTNPFFNVLNLKLIRSKFSKEAVKQFDYKSVVKEMEDKFPKEILFSGHNFNRTDYEPYYPFFFWLAYNFKTLYLVGEKHLDGISTILHAPDGRIICMHSWLARFYNVPGFFVKYWQKDAGKQKQRIDSLIDEVYGLRGFQRPHLTRCNHLQFVFDELLRLSIKIPQRIMGWPRKWAKWYRRWQEKNR